MVKAPFSDVLETGMLFLGPFGFRKMLKKEEQLRGRLIPWYLWQIQSVEKGDIPSLILTNLKSRCETSKGQRAPEEGQ